MKIDLHCHTTCSDGRLTPRELQALARAENLSYLALTDHDTIKGHLEMAPFIKDAPFHYIPGIELTTSQRGESIHILGFFKDEGYKNESFQEKLQELHEARDRRIQQFVKNLDTHFNLKVSYEAMRRENHGVLTRANLARAVHEEVPHLSYNDTFLKYLDKDSPAYIPNVKLSVEQGIALLKSHGALVVLAHPIIYKKNSLEELLAHDFDGVECYYFLNDEAFTKKSLTLAKEKDLYITVGSDYHGIEGDVKHGFLGSMTYDEENLAPFLQWYHA